MSKKQEHKRQRQQQKKKRRDQARQQRAREHRRASKISDPMRLAGLPLGDCYISDNWSDHGPRVSAVFVRRHRNGQSVAAFFELDLLSQGMLSSSRVTDLSPAGLDSELAQRSERTPLVVCEPALIVKVVEAARAMSDGRGELVTHSYNEAVALFGVVLSEDCPHEILTGAPPLPPEKPGVFAGLRRRLGLG